MMRPRFAFLAASFVLVLVACVDHATEHRVRANAFFRGADYASALEECDEGLKAKPDDVGTLILRGKSLFELNRVDDAKRDFDRAVELGEGRRKSFMGDAYLGLAIIASRQKEWEEARTQFEKLLSLDPQDVGTHTNLARVYLELGDLPKAEEHADFAVRARPRDEAALFVLGQVRLSSGKLDDAKAAYDKIVENNPKAPSGPYGLATVAARQGDKATALAKLREAVALKVPNPADIPLDPAFASIKLDPEFVEIVAGAAK
jgi:tetratricopeptide (TPR) repeat protein